MVIQNEPNHTKTIIHHLVNQRAQATPAQLDQIINHIAVVPFATTALEVDQPLWGGFWHFDVIAPGYRLPAVELALLRAIRLDQSWPEETGVEQFLTDLRQTILQPQAGIWMLAVAGQPCVVLAASTKPYKQSKPIFKNRKSKIVNQKSITVVWYCATTGYLHAGYRTAWADLATLPDVTTHRKLPSHLQTGLDEVNLERPSQAEWIAEVLEDKREAFPASLAAQLDVEILRLRLGVK